MPVPMIAAPVVMIAAVNTACRGSRRCTPNNVTTPIAAPTPNAIIENSERGVAATEHVLREERSERDDHAAADQTTGETDHDALRARSGFDRTNRSPSTMSCHVWATGTRLIRPRSCSSRVESRDEERGHQEGGRIDPDGRSSAVRGRTPGAVRRRAISNAGEDRVETAPTRNVPYAATRPNEFAAASWLGILHDVRHAARPWPDPRAT